MNAALRVADGESWELRTRHTRGDVDPIIREIEIAIDRTVTRPFALLCEPLAVASKNHHAWFCFTRLREYLRMLTMFLFYARLCTFGSWECNHFVNFILLSVLPNRQQLWFVMLQRETSSNYGSMIIFMHWKVVTSCHVIKYLFIYFTNHLFFLKQFDKITNSFVCLFHAPTNVTMNMCTEISSQFILSQIF